MKASQDNLDDDNDAPSMNELLQFTMSDRKSI